MSKLKSTKTEIEVKLSLLENGIDFINKGIDELFGENFIPRFEDTPTAPSGDLKYGVLHLFSGFLLLLKFKLVQLDGNLLFNATPIDMLRRAKRTTLPRFGDKTIDFQEIINGLKYGLDFEFSEEDLKIIKLMQGYRNTFEHYEVTFVKEELGKEIISFLIVIEHFLDSKSGLADNATEYTIRVTDKITKINEVWNAKKKRLLAKEYEELKQISDRFWRSGECQPTSEETERAEIEGYNEDEILALRYTTIQCPDCSLCSLVVEGELTGICVNGNCRNYEPVTSCDICGTVIPGFYMDDWNYCEVCADIGNE